MSFNTQPPEGGCCRPCLPSCWSLTFQHTAARRRLPARFVQRLYCHSLFQHTAARRRLPRPKTHRPARGSGFNTQPPEGGCFYFGGCVLGFLGFNTQPPEGGCHTLFLQKLYRLQFQHTAARRRLRVSSTSSSQVCGFQHTAARRRLLSLYRYCPQRTKFQHTAARRRLLIVSNQSTVKTKFQHTAARRRLRN
ncbi:Uncharacterised protein [Neisseria zoodegmatis]|uniref:Uncharacterized protein n=1 Tax=Neisseria zoodegmatis TaxID=326523 RepID=A0AB38DNL7_9NEIS|nr:Uncharacterised protein [Neisseria zoodegmatis]